MRKPKHWKIILKEEDLLIGLNSLKRPCLFFQGASKCNLGKAGVGGYTFYQEKANTTSFEWGLGTESNYKAEAYGFLLEPEILTYLEAY